jgi:hypothetical protein
MDFPILGLRFRHCTHHRNRLGDWNSLGLGDIMIFLDDNRNFHCDLFIFGQRRGLRLLLNAGLDDSSCLVVRKCVCCRYWAWVFCTCNRNRNPSQGCLCRRAGAMDRIRLGN